MVVVPRASWPPGCTPRQRGGKETYWSVLKYKWIPKTNDNGDWCIVQMWSLDSFYFFSIHWFCRMLYTSISVIIAYSLPTHTPCLICPPHQQLVYSILLMHNALVFHTSSKHVHRLQKPINQYASLLHLLSLLLHVIFHLFTRFLLTLRLYLHYCSRWE